MSYRTLGQRWWDALPADRQRWWRLQAVEHLMAPVMVRRAAEHMEAGRGWPRWAEAIAVEAAYACHTNRHEAHPHCDPWRPEQHPNARTQGAHAHDRTPAARARA